MNTGELAHLYGVETKQLKRAVGRNTSGFPKDFMFELSQKEPENLRRQIGTSSRGGIGNAFQRYEQRTHQSGQHSSD
jgi:hypothetical protein